MGMSSLWLDTYERIEMDFIDGKIDLAETRRRLIREFGMDDDELWETLSRLEYGKWFYATTYATHYSVNDVWLKAIRVGTDFMRLATNRIYGVAEDLQ